MRIAVKGTSGAGKTTLARGISVTLGIPHTELDALNWGPHWFNRSVEDPDDFRRRVDAATSGDDWISCGSYSAVDDLVLGRASHLVWLDYSRAQVMRQVIFRSFARACDRRELWPETGNRESFLRWFDGEHPIPWAWTTWSRRREYYARIQAGGDFAPLHVDRIRSRREIPALLDRLARAYEHPGSASA